MKKKIGEKYFSMLIEDHFAHIWKNINNVQMMLEDLILYCMYDDLLI